MRFLQSEWPDEHGFALPADGGRFQVLGLAQSIVFEIMDIAATEPNSWGPYAQASIFRLSIRGQDAASARWAFDKVRPLRFCRGFLSR